MAVPNIHSDVANALDDGITLSLGVYQGVTKVVALSGEAANYAEATTDFGSGSGKRMASVTVTSGDFLATGTGLTAKVSFSGKAGGTPHVAGNPTVLAYLNEGASKIIAQVPEGTTNNIVMTEMVHFAAQDLIGFTALTA